MSIRSKFEISLLKDNLRAPLSIGTCVVVGDTGSLNPLLLKREPANLTRCTQEEVGDHRDDDGQSAYVARSLASRSAVMRAYASDVPRKMLMAFHAARLDGCSSAEVPIP